MKQSHISKLITLHFQPSPLCLQYYFSMNLAHKSYPDVSEIYEIPYNDFFICKFENISFCKREHFDTNSRVLNNVKNYSLDIFELRISKILTFVNSKTSRENIDLSQKFNYHFVNDYKLRTLGSLLTINI